MRGGFTLTEMLVAMAVIMAVSGIGLAALFMHRNTNRVLAAEQVIADILRQARSTAKTSGEPVVVHIAQSLTSSGVISGTVVSGISRQCIWSQTFDNSANLGNVAPPFESAINGTYPDTDPTTGLTIGRSGFGVWPKILNPGGTDPTTITNVGMIKNILQHPLDPHTFLVSPLGNHTTGFYLACNVRPPAAYATPYNPIQPVVIPLVVIADGSTDFAHEASTIAGLQLIQAQTPTTAQSSSVIYWDLQGWVNCTGQMITIDQFALNGIPMIPGDLWEDVGLLYDGQSLQLFRNGHAIIPTSGLNPAVPASNTLFSPPSETVFIGHYIPTVPTPNILLTADAVIDDVRLFRLASDRSVSFPQVVTETPGAMTLTPDGQVQFTSDLSVASDQYRTTQAAYRDPSAGSIMAQGASLQELVTPVSGAMIFTKRTQGQLDPGPGNALMIAITTTGTITSSLASMEQDIHNTGNYYAVYSRLPP